MEKEFDKWNELKKNIEKRNKIIFYKEREIWFCSIGHNIGSEENGKNKPFERPVIIIKKINNNLFLGIPTSTKLKEDDKNYFKIEYSNKFYSALINQVRVFSTKRLNRKVCMLNKEFFNFLLNKIIKFIK